jgi:hypothetical protein
MELGKRKMAMSFRLKPNSLTRNFFLDTKRTLDQEPFANEVDTRMGFKKGTDPRQILSTKANKIGVDTYKQIASEYDKVIEQGFANKSFKDVPTFREWIKDFSLDNYGREFNDSLIKKISPYLKISSQQARIDLFRQLVNEANQGLKFVQRVDLKEQAGLSRSQATSEKAWNIPDLDIAKDKHIKAFNFLTSDPNRPVEELFDFTQKVAQATGTSKGEASATLNALPEYKNFKPIADRLNVVASKAALVNKGKTLADVEDMLYNIGQGGSFRTSVTNTPENFIINSVTRHIDQGGNKIKWIKKPGDVTNAGELITDRNAVFNYKGKNYSYDDLLTKGRDIPQFKEVYKSFDQLNDLYTKEVIHPVTKQKVIFGDLMKEAYTQGANYSSAKSPYDIDHFKSVKDEPFTNLRVIPKRINVSAGQLGERAKQQATGVTKTKQYTPEFVEFGKEKMGYNFSKNPEQLFKDELKLAEDILVKGRELRTPTTIAKERYKVLSTDALGAIGCPNSFMSGGRVKFSTGDSCVRKGLQAIESGKLDKAQLNAYENILQKSGKLTDEATQLFKTAKKAGSATGKLFEGLISVGTGITGAVGGVGLEVGMGYDQLARGDIRGFFRDSILGIVPGTFKSRREELLDITQSEEERVGLTNLFDYQDKYNQAVELENRIYARENDPLEGLIEGAEPFDVLAAQKELAQIDSELEEMYPKVQNEQVQNLVDTVSDRLTLEKTKKFDGPYGTIMGRGSLERDLPNILAEEKQKAYQEDPETIYQKQQQAPGMAPVIIDPDTLDLNFSRGMFANGSHSNPEIQKILDLIPQLMIADFVPISEKVELKRLFDQFNDRYMRKAEGGRIGFNKGGFDPTKRSFLKLITALAALPVVGKYIKLAKPVTKVIPKIDIVQTTGMPTFYSKMVNDALNYGVDKTKELGTLEREVVKQHKFGEYDVTVSHQLDTGDVNVQVNGPGTLFGEPVQMNYRAPKKTETGETIPADFKTNEAAVRGSSTGPDDYEITAEDDFIVEDTNKLGSNLTKLEEAVTGKDVPKRKKIVREDRQKYYESQQGQEQVLDEKYGYFDDTQPEDFIDE